MLAYLPPVLLLSLGWFLQDPVSLLAVTLISIWTLLAAALQKNQSYLNSFGSLILFGFFSTYLVSTLVNDLSIQFSAQGVYQRNFGLLFWLSLLLVFAVASGGGIKTKVFIWKSLSFALVFGIFYGGIQILNLDPFPWVNPFNAVQLSLGNPNFAGALLGMLATIPSAYLFKEKTFGPRILAIFVLGLTLIVALGTKSLQAIVVFVLGIIVFVSINFFHSKNLLVKSFRLISAFCGFFILLLLPFILFTKIPFLDGIREKFFSEGSIAPRLDYWRTGIEIFRDNFWFGVGPDQFQRYAALYRTKDQVIRDGAFVIPDKAHSVLIDALANGGIFAGLLWVIFVIFIFVKLILTVRMELSSERRLELSVLGAIWSGYIFQALISPDQLVLAVIGFMSAGLIVYINRSQVKLDKTKSKLEFLFDDPWYLRTVFIAVLIFASAVWGQAISADIAAKKVINNENLTRESVLAAVNKWPAPETTELIAVAVSQADAQCDLADELADRLIELDDRSAQGWYLKAICFNTNREFDKALSASENALKFDPLNPTYLVAKAKLGIASGQKNSAQSALAAIKENYPDNPEITPLETSISVMP